MVFPSTPREVETGLFMGGVWVDATNVEGGVLVRDPIQVSRGRSNWSSKPDPSKASSSLANRTGYWSPDNPSSPFSGFFKRNIPYRVGVGQGDRYLRHDDTASKETLSTPSSAALNVSGNLNLRWEFEFEEDLRPLTLEAAGEVVRARVAHKFSGTAGWEVQMYVTGDELVAALAWVDSAGSHERTSQASGAAIPLSLMWTRGALWVQLVVATGAVSWFYSDAIDGTWTQIGTADAAAGPTNVEASTAPLRFGGNPSDVTHDPFPGKLYAMELADGATVVASPDLRGQANEAASFSDTQGNVWTVGAGGRITNRRWRLHAELASIPLRWNVSGQDIWTPIEAQGLFRRLRQGAQPLESALTRGTIRRAQSLIDYWPMEDVGDNITHFGNSVGLPQMVAAAGEQVKAGAISTFLASKPIPEMVDATISAATTQPAATGALQFRWLQHVPSTFTAVTPIQPEVIGFTTTDVSWRVQFRNDNGGDLRILGFRGPTLVYTGPWIVWGAVGTDYRMSFTVEDNGANVDIALLGRAVGGAVGGFSTTTAFAAVTGQPVNVVINNNTGAGIPGWGIGQVSVQNAVTNEDELLDELNAHIGEKAGTRIQRLCIEEGVGYRFYGDPTDTEAMGPQLPDTLPALLEDCQKTDIGILSEARDSSAVWYRTRRTIELQDPPALTLDYANSEVGGSPDLDRDDQNFSNDVTAKNASGTESRTELDDGSALSVSPPPTGAGRYPSTYDINGELDTRLPDVAAAVLRLRSPDEPRASKLGTTFQQRAIATNPTLSETVLDLELGDRVDITNLLPEALGAGGSISQIVQSISDVIGSFRHSVSWNTTPYAPWSTSLLPGAPVPPPGGSPGGPSASFNNGVPGDFVVADIPGRETWIWNYLRDYFEPQHNAADTGPVRQVWVSAAGGGNGLAQGTPTTIANYMASTGITPTAGDQVRFIGVGPHNVASGSLRSIKGTAANPIRFVRDDPAVEPLVQNSAGASSLWPFSDSEYLGFHGLDITGIYPTNNNIWGLSFGQRFSGDTAAVRCRFIDIWHSKIHDMAQNCLTFEGTNAGGADNKSHDLHVFACDIYNSGRNTGNSFSEPTYFGSGSDDTDNAYNVCLEATYIHDGPSGEGTDIKTNATDFYIVGVEYYAIRVTSQGAIAAMRVADLYVHYVSMWDIDEVATTGNDGCGIWCSSMDVDYVVMWDIGGSAFVGSNLQRGTIGVVVKHWNGYNLQTTNNFGSGDVYHQNTSVFNESTPPVLNFDSATTTSPDGDEGTITATVSDYVGPTTGTAELTAGRAGTGFTGATGSAIAAEAFAHGKQ